MKGEISPGSSGDAAPIGVQLRVRYEEIAWARVEDGFTTPRNTARELPSYGWIPAVPAK